MLINFTITVISKNNLNPLSDDKQAIRSIRIPW
ncbi:MAG: hypothetical protein ACI8T1_004863 [Verrucomicrobiales bacterium]